MRSLDDPRFFTMIICLAFAVFFMTLNGHRRGNMVEAPFGFLGLAWATISVSIFLVFGWKIGVLCLAGCYFFVALITPVAGIIAGLLRGEFSKKQPQD